MRYIFGRPILAQSRKLSFLQLAGTRVVRQQQKTMPTTTSAQTKPSTSRRDSR